MLPQHRAQFIDVDKGFSTVGLSASQTSSQGVSELHGGQELGAGLGVFRCEEGQDLGAVPGDRRAVLHKLEIRKVETTRRQREEGKMI